MKHHFNYIVFLFLIACSSASTNEVIIPDTSTSSSTTTIVTTTTTMPVVKEEKQFKGEKAYISELEVGDCYVDEELNYLPKFYKEIVFKTPCEIEHNSEIVFKTQFSDPYLPVLSLEAEAGFVCNQFASLTRVVEYVDRKYEYLFFHIEPIFDSVAVETGEQSEIICSAYLEHVDSESDEFSSEQLLSSYEIYTDKSMYDWSILNDDINFYVFDTVWDMEIDHGIACQSGQYEIDPFYADFLMYYALPQAEIAEMYFTYTNSTEIIKINMMNLLSNFSDSLYWTEDIFYYFMPTSQIATEFLLSGEGSSDNFESLFTEPAENVSGLFEFVTTTGESYSATCSMGN